MTILLAWSTTGIASGKKFVATSEGRPFWKFWSIKNTFNLTSDREDRPKSYTKKYFSWWWHHRWRQRVTWKFLSLFMFRKVWLRGQVARAMHVSSINLNIVIVFLGSTRLKKISINNTDRRSKVNVTGLVGDLGTWTTVTPSILG